MIRRLLAGVAAGVLGVGLMCTTAAAQETIDGGEWAGSFVNHPPAVTSDPGSTPVEGAFVRDRSYGQPSVTMTITPPAGLAGSCPHGTARSIQSTVTPEGSGFTTNRYRFSWNVPFGPRVCNGTYGVEIVADVVGDDPRLTTSIDVAVPPAMVLGVTADEVDDRVVEVSWGAPADPPPDLVGYTVVRSASSDETRFAVDDPAATSFTDDDLPAEGGTVRYQVLARRWAPGGEVTSTGGEAAQPVTVAPAPDDTDPAPGGGSGAGSGTGGGTAPGAAPGGPATPRFRAPLVGSVSSGLVPPLLRPSPPTTVDDGFAETLPFEDAEPGEEEAVPPGDELASAFYEGEAGRGLVIPIATALVLAVWAFHLRFLSKAARPIS